MSLRNCSESGLRRGTPPLPSPPKKNKNKNKKQNKTHRLNTHRLELEQPPPSQGVGKAICGEVWSESAFWDSVCGNYLLTSTCAYPPPILCLFFFLVGVGWGEHSSHASSFYLLNTGRKSVFPQPGALTLWRANTCVLVTLAAVTNYTQQKQLKTGQVQSDSGFKDMFIMIGAYMASGSERSRPSHFLLFSFAFSSGFQTTG